MIHIATVHYKTDRWVDIQLKHLAEHIGQPYRVYAFLCGQAAGHREKFFYSCVEPIADHATKLNILADIIGFAARDQDEPLIFIDGDAFPIHPLDRFIELTLRDYPLAAIQRLENIGDRQPHPSFCLTTPRFWKGIGGDWRAGHEWTSSLNAPRSDVGGNLLKLLEERGIEWMRMHRSAENPFHPVLFGVYHDLIYHHGAGYRPPLTIHDRTKSLRALYCTPLALALDALLGRLSLKNRFRAHRLLGINRKLIAHNERISHMMYSRVASGDLRPDRLAIGDSPAP